MGKLQRFCRKCVHQYKTFKKCGREFANVIMQKVKNPFWEDYLNITRNCMANVFLLHLMILLQNVYITMLIYAEGKGSFYLKKNVLTVVLSQLANFWDLMDLLLTMNLKQNVRLLTITICYRGVYWLQLKITKGNWV